MIEDIFAAMGLLVVIFGLSLGLGGLLAFFDYVWPGFIDRTGERSFGRDVWRD